MPDIVVTIPKWFGLHKWVAEGDAAGQPWSGQLWNFYTGGRRPDCLPGDRVYIVFNGKLRGYAPLVSLRWKGKLGCLTRGGGAVAVTIAEHIRGFPGWRYRWWSLADERSFPDWMKP